MRTLAFVLAVLLAGCSNNNPPPPPPLPSPLVLAGGGITVAASPVYGNAIFSLSFRGVQYIDTVDHGRELQTAWQLDGQGEANNPTEAGAAADMNTMQSSTIVLSGNIMGNVLSTSVHPAFWLPVNGMKTAPDTLSKTVTLTGNVLDIQYSVTTVYSHKNMTVEGITGYLPVAFNRFFTFDLETGERAEAAASSVFPVNFNGPIVAATADLSSAIGCYSYERDNPSVYGVIGGVVTKIDCNWFRIPDAQIGTYAWHVAVPVGTLDEVTTAIRELMTQPPAMAAMSRPVMVPCDLKRCSLPRLK